MTYQKGVSIYLAIIIIFILLGIALGLSTLLVGQIKLVKGLGDSVVAFHAADTGVEKALYEEKLCRQTGCPLPPSSSPSCPTCSCRACCQGLDPDPTKTSISGTLEVTTGNFANYTTTVTHITESGQDMIHFTSRGEYKGTKRAIDTSIPQSPALSFTPWQFCQTGIVSSSFPVVDYRWGYRFIPNKKMTVKKLCGRWPTASIRSVVLQNSTFAVLKTASVTGKGNPNWACEDISLPYVTLQAGETYYVSEHGSSSDKSFYAENLAPLLPKDCSSVSIKATCVEPASSGGTKFTGSVDCTTTNKMYGEADFVATCDIVPF